MRKVILATAICGSLLFTGCGQAGIAMNNVGSTSVKQAFEIGQVIDSHKVLIDKGHLEAVGGGALMGAAAGAALGSRASGQHALVGALIGTVVGATTGLVASTMGNGNEVEAYETMIQGNGRVYSTYLQYDLPKGTFIEYIVRTDGTISNIDVKRPGKRVN